MSTHLPFPVGVVGRSSGSGDWQVTFVPTMTAGWGESCPKMQDRNSVFSRAGSWATDSVTLETKNKGHEVVRLRLVFASHLIFSILTVSWHQSGVSKLQSEPPSKLKKSPSIWRMEVRSKPRVGSSNCDSSFSVQDKADLLNTSLNSSHWVFKFELVFSLNLKPPAWTHLVCISKW